MGPASARSRRFGEILQELIEQCAAFAVGPMPLVDTLDALVDALDATSAVLERPDGTVERSSAADDDEEGEDGDAVVSVSADGSRGSRVTVHFDGSPAVTQAQLEVLALLVGLVDDIAAGRRASDARFDELRQAWGQEIHEGVTRSVTTAIGAIERVRTSLTDESARQLLEVTEHHVQQSLVELRDVLECVVDDDGHLIAPDQRETLKQIVDDVKTRWRLQARISVRGELAGVEEELASVARAIVRESLINVAKHAGAGRVAVRVHVAPAQVSISIVDDGVGVGAAPSAADERGYQLGLRLLEQRVALVGGSISVTPARGGGTEVLALLPRSRPRPR